MREICNRFTAGAGYAVDVLADVRKKLSGLRLTHTMHEICNTFTARAGCAVNALAIMRARPTGLRKAHTMRELCNRFTAGAGYAVNALANVRIKAIWTAGDTYDALDMQHIHSKGRVRCECISYHACEAYLTAVDRYDA